MTDREFDKLDVNISLKEMKDIQLDIIRKLARFCDNNGLRYYMTGGTLLGAVRHHGFIPWDDDIDINMPRPDYEKFIALTNNKLDKYIVVSPMKNNENDALVVKIYDPTTAVKETVETLHGKVNHYVHVFIDVFPLDGLPSNKILFMLRCLHVHLLVGFYRAAINGASGRNLIKQIVRIPMLPLAKAKGGIYWKERIQRVCLKNNFDKSKKIGVLLSRNRFKDYLDKEKYLPYDDSLSFEGFHFHAPLCYKEHLNRLYGNYMHLPPVEKRNSGHELIGKRILT